MQTIRKYWLVVFVALSVIYVGYYVSHEIHNVERVLRVSVSMITLTILLQTAFWLLASYLWQKIVLQVSSTYLTLPESFAQLCLVNIGKYLPGKVWGMLARGSHMNRRHGVAVEHIILATYLEQFFLLASGFVLIAVLAGLLLGPQWGWGLSVLALAGVVLGGYNTDRILWLITLIYSRVVRKQHRQLSYPPMRLTQYYLYLLSYAVVWILLGLVFCGVYLSFFPADLSMYMFGKLVLASTAAYSAGFLAIFAPGGVGVREAVSSAILVSQMSVSDAILLSFLFRLWTVIAELLIGGAMVLTMRRTAS